MKRRERRPLTPMQLYCCMLRCCVCKPGEQETDTRAHHEPPVGMGRGGDHDDVVPLCLKHHIQRHNKGVKTFWAMHCRDWIAEVERVHTLFEREGKACIAALDAF